MSTTGVAAAGAVAGSFVTSVLLTIDLRGSLLWPPSRRHAAVAPVEPLVRALASSPGRRPVAYGRDRRDAPQDCSRVISQLPRAATNEHPGTVSHKLESWLEGDGDKTVAGLIGVFEEKSFAILFVVLL